MMHTEKNATPLISVPLISVIVPCCDVEKYLRECMDSITGQSLEDMEIICLNDGSKDGTLEILREYERKDSRVRVIDKPNTGYGATVNMGLELSRGKYVGIIESDDYIEPEMFEKLCGAAERDDLDYVRCLFREFNEVEGTVRDEDYGHFVEFGTVFRPLEHPAAFMTYPAIWAAVYRRTFLNANGIRFLETPGASYQDISFAFKVALCAERSEILPDVLHNYRINGNSSVSSHAKVFCVCDEDREMRRFAEERGLYAEIREMLALRTFINYKWNYNRLASMEMKRKFMKVWSPLMRGLLERGEVTSEWFSTGRRFRTMLIAYAPWLYYFVRKA